MLVTPFAGRLFDPNKHLDFKKSAAGVVEASI
jgi:hypothetical protein